MARALVCAAWALSTVTHLAAQEIESAPGLRSFLLERAELTESDLSAVDSGRVVTRSLEVGDDREIGVLSVARVAVPARFVIPFLRDAETYGSSAAAAEMGRFSVPARLEDLRSLSFPRRDIRDLESCRVGACEIKLSERTIRRFQEEVRWDSPDHSEQVSALAREMLLEYVETYRSGGDEALGVYADKPERLSIAQGFDELLESARYLQEFFPELFAYLSSYPGDKPADAEDFIYWLREDFGLKPVVSLYHATVYTPEGPEAPPAIVTLKQLYASHYFQAALSVIGVVDGGQAGGEPAAYLIFARRARFDGPLTGFRRSLVRVRVQDDVTETLRALRVRLEEAHRGGQTETRDG